MRQRTPPFPQFVTLAIMALAFGVRVWQLGAQSIWFDEGWSWHLARMPLTNMVEVTASDRSPVLYYSLLHGWLALTGVTEYAMRYMSLMADMLALAGVIALSRKASGPRAGVVAAMLYTVSPSAIWYAQETRMYAQVAALCTLSTLFLWRWLDTPARRSALIASAILLALAIHSHYYAIFLLPAHALVVFGTWLACKQRVYSDWIAAAAGLVAIVVPWLLYARRGFAYNDGFAFPLNTIDGRLTEWLRWFISGGLPVPLAPWQWALFGIPLGLAIIRLATTQQHMLLFRLLTLGCVPLLAATIAVRIFFPYSSVFHPRYLVFVAPIWCIVLSAAAAAPHRAHTTNTPTRIRNTLEAALGLLPLLVWIQVLSAYFNDPVYQRDNTRDAVQHVVEALEPGDVIVTSRDNFAVNYYFPVAQRAQLLAAPDGLQGVLSSDQVVLDKLNPLTPKRVRLLLWQDSIVDPQKLLETTLRANGRQIGEYNFGQIRLPLYQIERLPLQALPLKPAPPDTRFEDGANAIQLSRFWISSNAKTNDLFYVVLEWQARGPISHDYKVFVHVTDVSGTVVFQQDKLTLSELLPTSTWKTGQNRRDPYAMLVPVDLPAGRYSVRVGLYDPERNLRMRLSDGDSRSIAEIEISR